MFSLGGGHPIDLWDVAVNPSFTESIPGLAGARITSLRYIETWIYEALSLARHEGTVASQEPRQPLRIFISHGGKTAQRDSLQSFIYALGALPLIVEDQANEGLTPNTKVQRDIDLAHYGVVLGTHERAAMQDGQPTLRGNLADERARLAHRLGADHVLIAVEKGIQLPSNISEFLRVEFAGEQMNDIFVQLVVELVKLKLLKSSGSPL